MVSEGLFHEGVTSIGIPIFNGKGEVLAAVTVSSISQKMDKKRRREIVEIVKRITRTEGHQPGESDKRFKRSPRRGGKK